MIKTLDGKTWALLIKSGANNLINDKNKVDALNVFPVPDGDTGTNMSSTIQSASEALNDQLSNDLSEVALLVSKKMLFGARGNSGVILSQIFKGFSLAFEGQKEVDVLGLLNGFKKATEKAYQSVLKPVEGTILTVIRESTEELEKIITKETTFEELFAKLDEFSRTSCKNTPNKLKILREVGVTDSGGEGLQAIFKGMYLFTIGQAVELNANSNEPDAFIKDGEVYNGEFGYCTEFIVELAKPEDFNKEQFQKALSKKATSLVVVQDNEILKVHGHTLKPGDLLNFGQKYGEFVKIKSENMTKQAADSRNKNVILNQNDEAEIKAKCGTVSCNLGSGIINRMKDLGCDVIVESGQTQNPSAQDIIDAINTVKAKNVFVFPNNSNIFLAAEQASQAITNKKIFIIPTKTQTQGITAMLNFDKEANASENKEVINEAIKLVKTGEVTKSTRNVKLNGIKIKKDQFIAIAEGKIIAASDDFLDTAKQMIKKILSNNEIEIITIYYGNDATESDANELQNFVQAHYDAEVEIVNGNQPNYHFIIAFE